MGCVMIVHFSLLVKRKREREGERGGGGEMFILVESLQGNEKLVEVSIQWNLCIVATLDQDL